MNQFAHLIRLQANGNQHPIFAIHPISGHSYCYKTLSRKLTQNRPFYGIENLNFYAKHQGNFYCIEQLIAQYFDEIKTLQPQGPYIILSWCIGSFFAYELSKYIESCGECVKSLILIDPPQFHGIDSNAAIGLKEILTAMGMENLDFNRNEFTALTPTQSLMYIFEKLMRMNDGLEQRKFTEVEFQHLKRFVKAHLFNLFAVEQYRLQSQIEHITICKSQSIANDPVELPSIDWQNYSRKPVVKKDLNVPEHAVLEDPNVSELAAYLNTLI